MIGPVKGFVENGRKMRDLYAGSSILSELINQATIYLEKQAKQEEYKLKVVFPPPMQRKQQEKEGEEKEINVPNRLVVDINENFDEKAYECLAEKLTCFIKNEFTEICKKSLENTKNLSEKEKVLFYDQLKCFLEVFWLFEPYEDEKEYASTYRKMIANTEAIKSIRSFEQTKEPWGRKCLLHPEYNGIFVKENKDKKYPANTNTDHIIKLPNVGKFQFDIKEGEALSAIAFAKRMYSGTNSRFISPRDIVLKDTLTLKTGDEDLFRREIADNCILKNPEMKNLGVNMTHLTDAIYDVWDDNFAYDKSDPNKPELEYPEKVLFEAQSLSKRLKDCDELKKFKLQQYYAIIKFDGDSMGVKYSRLKDRKAHGQLSEEICEFANDARKIVENVGGICIYAGGEDVLAVLTIQNLWCTLQKLHARFFEIGAKKIEGTNETFAEAVKKKDGNEDPFTFSAGIVIAHLKSPLKDVMRQVGDAEKDAKKIGKKNAFAISLMKRGSETRTIKYSFGENYEQLQAFASLIDLFSVDQNSRSFVYNLSHLLLRLTKDSIADSNRAMIHTLIKQAIHQQRIGEERKVVQCIKVLYENVNTEDLMNTLDIIGFLSGRLVGAIEPIKKEVQDDVVQN